MPVPILVQGDHLIASIQDAMTDQDAETLRDDLMERIARHRAHVVIVDVTAVDVMDSFAARSLRTLAHMARLRGAKTVIAGIQPDVAYSMVQMGLLLQDVPTRLDLEDALEFLQPGRRPEAGFGE